MTTGEFWMATTIVVITAVDIFYCRWLSRRIERLEADKGCR